MKIRKAVIPAAGFGTRFLPATKAMPKEMLPIVDKPIIQYVVEEAVAAGIEDILVITGRGKRAIEDHFDRSIELEQFLASASQPEMVAQMRSISEMANLHFIRQPEALGLGHAVLQARQHIGNEPFAVLLGDEIFVGSTPCLTELIEQRETHGQGSVIAVRDVELSEVRHYGVIEAERVTHRLHHVNALIEKPTPEETPSTLAVVGRYIIVPEIFDILQNTPPGRNGEIQLTDALNVLARHRTVYGYEVQATRYDVGSRLGYIRATVEFALNNRDLGDDVRAFLSEIRMNLPIT